MAWGACAQGVPTPHGSWAAKAAKHTGPGRQRERKVPMIIEIDLKTKEQTIIEPMNAADIARGKEITKQLYYAYQNQQREGLQRATEQV